MSRSLPPTPKTTTSASLPRSLATFLPPFSTTPILRLQALYSDFSRQKQSNSTSYHANVEWWRKALEAIVSSGKQCYEPQPQIDEDVEIPGGMKTERLVLHANRELIERLKVPKAGKPLALDSVLSELQETPRGFFLLSLFMESQKSVYDPGWLPARIAKALVGRPLWWALEQMGVVGDEGILGSLSSSTAGRRRGSQHDDMSWWGDYVILPLVEKAADEVMERHEQRLTGSKADNLYSFEGFRKAFGGVVGGREDEILREIDANVLLKYLERDRRTVVVDQEVIKFISQATPLEGRTVTAIDRGILELRTAVNNLQAQVDSLHQKIDEYTRKATAALRAQRKSDAIGYLKSRKLLEGVLDKRLSSLHNLESTFIAVETAAGDVEIMESYKSSTATLRAILDHPSLGRSEIDETMEALAEANSDARDVDEAIRAGMDVSVTVDIDEAALEEELRLIVKEVGAEQAEDVAKQRKLQELDAIPKVVGLEEDSPEKEKIAIPST